MQLLQNNNSIIWGDFNMNKALLSLVFLMSLALFAGTVSADLAVSGATLGSSNMQPGVNASTTFTITNTDNSSVTGISLSSTAASGYVVSFSGAPTNLSAGASATVTVNGFIIKSHDAVTAAIEAASMEIGSLVATGTSNGTTVTASNTLSAQIENHLKIKKIVITVNGDEEHRLDDGDDVKDLKPGDKLDIRVEVENTFDEDDEIDIEDIVVRAEIDDSDFDLDEDEDISDISANEEDSVTFVDVEVEDEASGTYTLEVTVEGRGESP